MRSILTIVFFSFPLVATCMDSSKVITIDNGLIFGFTCNATFVNFSRGYNLYYPTLDAEEKLFDKIAETAECMSVDFSEYDSCSDKKIVKGNLNNLGLLVSMLHEKNKTFQLPEFISKSLPRDKTFSCENIPEGGVLITVDGTVFCNRIQFEWLKSKKF